MSVSITTYPERIINSDATTVSRWSAVHQPIVFKMHRKDDVCNINISGSTIYVFINDTSNLTVGDFVYIKNSTGNGVFEVLTIPNSISFTVAKGTVIISDGFGYMNYQTRLNYFISTKIYGVDANNNYYLLGESINKPDVSGRVDVDVSSFLKNAVDYFDYFNYNKINEKDLTLGGRFNIIYNENWTGNTGTYTELSPTVVRYFSNSVKQILELYGSNMGEYVPFSNKAYNTKFLSDFAKPTYFVGYPFSLSFIYSESLYGNATYKHESRKDLNGNVLSATSPILENTQSLHVNRLMLDESYASTVKEVDVWLENDGTSEPVTAYEAGTFEAGTYEEQTTPTPIATPEL